MAALNPGTVAPDFTLQAMDGKRIPSVLAADQAAARKGRVDWIRPDPVRAPTHGCGHSPRDRDG